MLRQNTNNEEYCQNILINMKTALMLGKKKKIQNSLRHALFYFKSNRIFLLTCLINKKQNGKTASLAVFIYVSL